MYRFVINQKYIKLLASIRFEPKTIKQLSSISGLNYFHLTEVINQFYREGIINKENNKNTFYISLTEKGEKITDNLLAIDNIINGRTTENEYKEA